MRAALAGLTPLVLLCSVAASCLTFPAGRLDMSTPAGDERWETVVRQHTRQVEVYDWAAREVDLRATLVTPRLRTAFIGAREQLHGRAAHDTSDDLLKLGAPPDEGVDAPIKAKPDAEEQVIVYVCFFVANRPFRDLAASYTVWDTHLVRGDARVEPLSMTQEPFSPAVEALLPHADRFDDVYIMRFPLVDPKTGTAMMSPGEEPLRLELKSALGYAVTSWTLVDGPTDR